MQFQIFTFLCVWKGKTGFEGFLGMMQRNAASREVNQACDSCDICPLPHKELHRFPLKLQISWISTPMGLAGSLIRTFCWNTWRGFGKSCHEINQKIYIDVLRGTSDHQIQAWAFFSFFLADLVLQFLIINQHCRKNGSHCLKRWFSTL